MKLPGRRNGLNSFGSSSASHWKIRSSSWPVFGRNAHTDSTANEDESWSDLHPAIRKARLAPSAAILNLDRTHLWHPYTSLVAPQPVLHVKHAYGCTLVLDDDTRLLDGMSSWWAAVWGYNHPSLNSAVQYQLSQMSHVMFGGLTHRPAAELASMLLFMAGGESSNLSKIFFTDSGSVAVEVALKIALQYQRGVNPNNRKTRILSVRGGYHGDTLHAMSVCDPVNGMHTAFQGVIPGHVIFAPRPPCDGAFRLWEGGTGCRDCNCRQENALGVAVGDLEAIVQEHHSTLAAMILEPIVQGAGGMRFYPKEYLRRARELCTEYNMLLICDEIATGFGRSSSDSSRSESHLFASLEAGVEPDILCLGKALTGGYMTLGCVMTNETVAQGVSSSPTADAIVALPLMHGPTFMANPLACAVSVASLNLMMQIDPESEMPAWQANVHRIEKELRLNLKGAFGLPNVVDVRVRGAIGVIELRNPLDNKKVPFRCRELGVWLRPFGRLLYTMPPYIMSNESLKKLSEAMIALAADTSMIETAQ